jgi:hypothetical protein
MRDRCAKGATILELLMGGWTSPAAVRLELVKQPDSRQRPVPFHRTRRNAQRRSNLFYGKAAKVSQLDDLGLAGILFLQPVERFVEHCDLFKPLG